MFRVYVFMDKHAGLVGLQSVHEASMSAHYNIPKLKIANISSLCD